MSGATDGAADGATDGATVGVGVGRSAAPSSAPVAPVDEGGSRDPDTVPPLRAADDIGPRLDDAEIDAIFARFRAVGSTLIVEAGASTRHWTNDPAANDVPSLPASTFKIPHALLALDLGIVDDPDAPFAWDGVGRGSSGWDRDLSLRQAVQRSAVWVFQRIAARIGPARMTDGLARLDYGNQSIDGTIDRFWLDGGLRITPREQITFLRRLHDRTLPTDPVAMATVIDIIEVDRGDGWVLRGKTGWAIAPEPDVGWWVGWLERDGAPTVFVATRLELHAGADAPKRLAVTHACLRHLGFATE